MTLAILAQLAPALLLLLLLAARHYPGERLLSRLATRRPPRRRAAPATATPRRPRSVWLRGGALIGRRLAVRPPPLGAGVR